MKGKYVIVKHLKDDLHTNEIKNYLNKNGFYYEFHILTNNKLSLSVCFASANDWQEAQYDFQDFLRDIGAI